MIAHSQKTETTPICLLPRKRLCRNKRKTETCHLERSERSCIFSHRRGKDFSPSARNYNCDAVSKRWRIKQGVLEILAKVLTPFLLCVFAPLREKSPNVSFRLLRHRAFYALFVSLMFFFPGSSGAQVSKEYQLKAVFLLRLAQFTQWPNDAFESPGSPIVICVLGENPFDDALEAAVRGETAHGRRLAVQYPRSVSQASACHSLFITGAGPRQAKEITAAMSGRSVLTVADGDELPSAYDAMIRFVTEQNKIKLRIHLKAVAANRLVLDPRLLRAAEIVGSE